MSQKIDGKEKEEIFRHCTSHKDHGVDIDYR